MIALHATFWQYLNFYFYTIFNIRRYVYHISLGHFTCVMLYVVRCGV